MEGTAAPAGAPPDEISALSRDLAAARSEIARLRGLNEAQELMLKDRDLKIADLQKRLAQNDSGLRARCAGLEEKHTLLLGVIARFAEAVRAAGLRQAPRVCMRPQSVPAGIGDPDADERPLREWLRGSLSSALGLISEVMRLREEVFKSSKTAGDSDNEPDPEAGASEGGQRIMTALEQAYEDLCRDTERRQTGFESLNRAAKKAGAANDAVAKDIARIEELQKAETAKAEETGAPAPGAGGFPAPEENAAPSGEGPGHHAKDQQGAGIRKQRRRKSRPKAPVRRRQKDLRLAAIRAELAKNLFFDQISGRLKTAHPLKSQDQAYTVFNAAATATAQIKVCTIVFQEDCSGVRHSANVATWPILGGRHRRRRAGFA